MGAGGCADSVLQSNQSAFTDTHCCVGMNCSKQPSVAHLPAFQVERKNSFIVLVWTVALPGFCAAIGTEGVSELSGQDFS